MNASPTAAGPGARARRISLAGWLILLLSAGSALLPEYGRAYGGLIIAVLLVAAGLVEISAGLQRRQARRPAIAAGAITMLAGFLFMTQPATHFLSAVTIIAGWLFLRTIVQGIAAVGAEGPVRTWMALSAAMDLALALILAVGLSIATLVVTLFGATPPLVASFAWVLALSFVTTGLMLLRIGSAAKHGRDV